jgi:hypothetical protein
MVTRLAPALLLLAAACGYKGPVTRLEPPDPALSREALAKAREAERAEVAAGLTPAADARPVRVDDLQVKLDVRPEDSFSLPPEGTRGARIPAFPGDPAPERPD